jgi:hypothetical protein
MVVVLMEMKRFRCGCDFVVGCGKEIEDVGGRKR